MLHRRRSAELREPQRADERKSGFDRRRRPRQEERVEGAAHRGTSWSRSKAPAWPPLGHHNERRQGQRDEQPCLTDHHAR